MRLRAYPMTTTFDRLTSFDRGRYVSGQHWTVGIGLNCRSSTCDYTDEGHLAEIKMNASELSRARGEDPNRAGPAADDHHRSSSMRSTRRCRPPMAAARGDRY